MTKYLGFSLLELTISILLSSMIMGLLMHGMWWVQQQIDTTLQEIQRVQEKAWIVSFLRASFYQAGFTPCRSLDELSPLDRREKTEALQSVELKKKDHFIFRHMSRDYSEVVQVWGDKIIVVAKTKIHPQYPLMISDCTHAEVQDIERVDTDGEGRLHIVLKKTLAYHYEQPFYAGEFVSEAFLMKHQSLFYQRHHVDELASWVHQMTGALSLEAGHRVLTLRLGETPHQIKIHGRN